jgi:hypothetical protein
MATDATAEVYPQVLGTTGDVNPIDHDGGVVFRDADGVVFWEWAERHDDAEDSLISVHCIAVPDDVFDYYDWADAAQTAACCGWDSAECLVEAGMSDDPMTRVAALESLKDYEGSRALDDDPLVMLAEDLEQRWSYWL